MLSDIVVGGRDSPPFKSLKTKLKSEVDFRIGDLLAATVNYIVTKSGLVPWKLSN